MNFESKNYIRTDLACESIEIGKKLPHGVEYSEEDHGTIKVIRMKIESAEAAARIGKSCGEYLTFDCGNMTELDDGDAHRLSRLLAIELIKMAEKICKKRVDSDFCILAAGLGNADMTPDAIGPEATSKITATGHIERLDPRLFSSLGSCRFYSVTPGVLGDTGIEAAELIRGAAERISPDLVVVLDALAARSLDRLASTVQMADSGINPGSGVGNKRSEISRKTLGVPVISIGVPTVVDSATLVCDMLDRAGIRLEKDELERALATAKSCFVAPRDSDMIKDRASCILADALDMAFGINRGELKYN